MISPGSNKAAEINAAIVVAAAGSSRDVELDEGIFYLESPVILKSNVTLRGVGKKTILTPTYTGGADDSTNCIIQCAGVLDTNIVNTTFSGIAARGEISVELTSAGSLSAGKYFVTEGINVGEQGGPTDGSLAEVCKVDSSYTSGTTIPLAWPKYQTNTIGGITVKGVIPVVDVAVENLRLIGNQSGTTASGVYVKYSVNVRVDNVFVERFSRGAIDVAATTGFKSTGLFSYGTNNCWYTLLSTCNFDVQKFDGADGVTRVHPAGFPRAQIYLRNRCTSGRIHDGVLTCGYAGVFHAGGVNLVFNNLLIKNQEITQAIYDRAVAGGEFQNLGRWVVGFGSGHGPLPMAEFAFGCTYSNIVVEDLLAPNVTGWNDTVPRRALAFYIHDTKSIEASNLVVHHFNINAPVSGFTFSDTDGVMKNLLAKGTPFGFNFENFNNYLDMSGVRFDAVRSEAGNAPLPFYFNYDASSASGPKIRDVQAANAFSFVDFGSSQVYDPTFCMYNVVTDGGRWDYVIMANNQTGVDFDVGDIVEIDAAYAGTDLRVVTPNTGGADYANRLAVVVGVNDDDNTGFLLIAPLPQQRASVKASTAAVAYGDRIGYVATRRAATAAGAAQPLGKALSRKAAGAEGMIVIGSAA